MLAKKITKPTGFIHRMLPPTGGAHSGYDLKPKDWIDGYHDNKEKYKAEAKPFVARPRPIWYRNYDN